MSYNAAQLSQKLAQERGVTLSSDRVRKVLKKRMRPSRSFTAARTRTKHRGGVGRGQDINHHRTLTPKKKKPKELI